MRRAIGGASILFAVSVVPAQAEMAIADYLAGTLDGLEAANAAARARGRPYYCPPEERTPTVLELKPALDQLLAEAVERQRDFERYARIVTVGTVSLTALARVFPCSETGAEGSTSTRPGG
jgi:DNA invertase Pin-like site-specific DNA recombinase